MHELPDSSTTAPDLALGLELDLDLNTMTMAAAARGRRADSPNSVMRTGRPRDAQRWPVHLGIVGDPAWSGTYTAAPATATA